ncbi:HAMP domain-containing histidine kinase, partial [Candidatus Saccharibacteria bacterium]|nr:HAMP domain-containing histidine kinase [Candidatus Saccharibacteria bacterium]
EDEDDPSYGYLTICAKRSKLYSDQEVKVLATIGSILAMAIKNTGHYEKIKKFNDELKEEVDNATHGLKIANQRLVKLNDTKDEFLSLASHQLRTPLTSVKGYLSMLLDGDFGEMTPTQKKIISDSFNSSQQMAVTISDFLDMSRIQTGRFTLSKESTDLAEILEFQLNQLQTTAQSRNVELTSEIDNDLPQVDVDRDKIAQVMMNFIDNAIYYSKPDSGVVKVSLYKDSNNLVFKVRDNGIGVPDDEKHHLFTKFYRADNAKAARPNGTGVGLYVARKVIVAHRGQIIFESKVGKGSMFGFKIPMG